MTKRGAKPLMALLAALFALIAANTVAAQPRQRANLNFTIVNGSGLTIESVWMRPSHTHGNLAHRWVRVALATGTIPAGASEGIIFPYDAADVEGTYWDIVVYDRAGKRYEWPGVNVAAISKLVLLYNSDSGETDAVTD